MGFCIEVLKTDQEDQDFVYYIYQFHVSGDKYISSSGKTRYKRKIVQGKIKIDKRNGDVHIQELAEGDKGLYAERAGWALMKHWKLGEYPDKTIWAS